MFEDELANSREHIGVRQERLRCATAPHICVRRIDENEVVDACDTRPCTLDLCTDDGHERQNAEGFGVALQYSNDIGLRFHEGCVFGTA